MAIQNGVVYFNGAFSYYTLYDLERKYNVDHRLIASMLLAVGLEQNNYRHWHNNGKAVNKSDEVILSVINTLESLACL